MDRQAEDSRQQWSRICLVALLALFGAAISACSLEPQQETNVQPLCNSASEDDDAGDGFDVNAVGRYGIPGGLDVVIRPDGCPLAVIYEDSSPSSLKFVACRRVDCSKASISSSNDFSWTDQNEGESKTGRYPDIEINSAGLPLVISADESVTLLRCSDPLCESGQASTIVRSEGQSGLLYRHPKIKLDGDGRPVMAFMKIRNVDNGYGNAKLVFQTLILATCEDQECLKPRISEVHEFSGLYRDNSSRLELSLGQDNLPILIYEDEEVLWFAKCTDSTCRSPLRTGIDYIKTVSPLFSMGINSRGELVIVHSPDRENLNIVRCLSSDCSERESRILETHSTTDPDYEPDRLYLREISLVLTPDDRPVIAYFEDRDPINLGRDDKKGQEAWVLTCTRPDCSNFTEREIDNLRIGTTANPAIDVDDKGNPVVAYLSSFNFLRIQRLATTK